MMGCSCCGKPIKGDSVFCPYCGGKQDGKSGRCPNCGKLYRKGDKFCGYCGTRLTKKEKAKNKPFHLPHINLIKLLTNRFAILYYVAVVVNIFLLNRAKDAYSDYYNSSNAVNHHGFIEDEIYPEDWLYPFSNIIHGIKGQDPIYVYDVTEFILYCFIMPILLFVFYYICNKRFNSEKVSNKLYLYVWYVSVGLLLTLIVSLFFIDILILCIFFGLFLLIVYILNYFVDYNAKE